jgi:isopenicillin N synthase-like dioxygenase
MSIEPPQDRLSAFTEVPIIDISGAPDPARRTALAKDMVKVAQDVGFMYVVGHGIDQKLVDDVFGMSKTFFALPDEEKRRIHLTKSKAYRGYLGLREKGNDPTFQGNNLEAFHCAEEIADDETPSPLRGRNQWPERPENFRNTVYTYFEQGYRLGETLLELLAEGLGEPSDTFLKYYNRNISYLRLLRYAQIDDPSVKLLARPHYDTGVITILAQDPSGGLEVLNKAGDWIAAPPVHGSFIINIGRTLQLWSGDRFTATRHHVLNRGGAFRYSMPIFMTPSYDTVVTPLGEKITSDTPTFKVGEEQLATYQRIWPAPAETAR